MRVKIKKKKLKICDKQVTWIVLSAGYNPQIF